MKKVQINDSVKQAFTNFLEVLEQEHGIKATDVEVAIHSADKEQVKAALELGGEAVHLAGDTHYVPMDAGYVWSMSNLSMRAFFDKSVLDAIAEEEEEEGWGKCTRCNEDVHESEEHSDVSNVCKPCGDLTMEEWEKEKLAEQEEYRRSVL